MAAASGAAWSRSEANGRGMILAYHAQQSPQRPALRSPAGERSFAELNANANRLARALAKRGLGPGDAVALFCGNRPEFDGPECIAPLEGASPA